ncbi:MAG: poly-gamma-glutamate system protein [Candidatus Aminicenantes bacterium]|nr:poly-gamma-glutamate system protein [Candidatus Aminicenantes bacterium]
MSAASTRPRTNALRLLYALALVSVAALLLARFLAFGPREGLGAQMRAAAETMERATQALARCRTAKGLRIDARADPNRTGLIGLESSPLTTSLGNLGAKRTTTNPGFAALIVRLLDEAGVRKGDAVAVGASSSFPALIVAVLSAARAMEVRPLLICSLGSSQYGANDPAFHWLDMRDCLEDAGVFDVRLLAVSIGGDADIGRNMDPETRAALTARISGRGDVLLEEPSLEKSTAARLRLYEEGAGRGGVKAFVNIGGSWANMGTDSRVLEVKPGLARVSSIPPRGKRGVLFEMARRGVPVIHLLFVRGLAESYGLPWDPQPLPRSGESTVSVPAAEKKALFVVIGLGYLVLAGLAVGRISGRGAESES